jgi:hypothetical protein
MTTATANINGRNPMSKQINDGEVRRSMTIYIRTPWDTEEVYIITEEQAARWEADPDLCAARYFGLSVEEYREWIKLDGQPLCGKRTKRGRPCGALLKKGDYHFDARERASEWKRRHRKESCHAHEVVERSKPKLAIVKGVSA